MSTIENSAISQLKPIYFWNWIVSHKSHSLASFTFAVIHCLEIIYNIHDLLWLYCARLLVVHLENRWKKRSNQMRRRLGLCLAEDSDLITSSLADLGPTETTAKSRKCALLVTATASGPSRARWALDGSSHTSGLNPSQAICKKFKVKELPVFEDDFSSWQCGAVRQSKHMTDSMLHGW